MDKRMFFLMAVTAVGLALIIGVTDLLTTKPYEPPVRRTVEARLTNLVGHKADLQFRLDDPEGKTLAQWAGTLGAGSGRDEPFYHIAGPVTAHLRVTWAEGGREGAGDITFHDPVMDTECGFILVRIWANTTESVVTFPTAYAECR